MGQAEARISHEVIEDVFHIPMGWEILAATLRDGDVVLTVSGPDIPERTPEDDFLPTALGEFQMHHGENGKPLSLSAKWSVK